MAKKKKNRSPKKKRGFEPSSWVMAAIIMLAMWLVGTLLPHRLTVLLCMVGGIASVVVFIKSFRSKSTSRLASWGFSFGLIGGLVSFCGSLFTVNAYAYYKQDMPLWKISLALGLMIGILITVKWFWKIFGFWGKIGYIALGTFLAFFLIWIPLCHLNYLLDFQPPVEKQAVIEEKEVTRHRKSPDSYEFELTVDGETFGLEVEQREYNRYEVGDTYTFYEYKGAFGKPFYLAEE